ncbi:unnamed protein product [Rangifer tarandus platyrhynchus]|uniref:Uncharacterized protein n=1 Tax=Rangifer tarandus platyrhynchus TaxID=3082113 RepID=A0ABN8XIW1_RANTA|nr:unnamed protein product [Rangifer tarandus platyrhynchus]
MRERLLRMTYGTDRIRIGLKRGAYAGGKDTATPLRCYILIAVSAPQTSQVDGVGPREGVLMQSACIGRLRRRLLRATLLSSSRVEKACYLTHQKSEPSRQQRPPHRRIGPVRLPCHARPTRRAASRVEAARRPAITVRLRTFRGRQRGSRRYRFLIFAARWRIRDTSVAPTSIVAGKVSVRGSEGECLGASALRRSATACDIRYPAHPTSVPRCEPGLLRLQKPLTPPCHEFPGTEAAKGFPPQRFRDQGCTVAHSLNMLFFDKTVFVATGKGRARRNHIVIGVSSGKVEPDGLAGAVEGVLMQSACIGRLRRRLLRATLLSSSRVEKACYLTHQKSEPSRQQRPPHRRIGAVRLPCHARPTRRAASRVEAARRPAITVRLRTFRGRQRGSRRYRFLIFAARWRIRDTSVAPTSIVAGKVYGPSEMRRPPADICSALYWTRPTPVSRCNEYKLPRLKHCIVLYHDRMRSSPIVLLELHVRRVPRMVEPIACAAASSSAVLYTREGPGGGSVAFTCYDDRDTGRRPESRGKVQSPKKTPHAAHPSSRGGGEESRQRRGNRGNARISMHKSVRNRAAAWPARESRAIWDDFSCRHTRRTYSVVIASCVTSQPYRQDRAAGESSGAFRWPSTAPPPSQPRPTPKLASKLADGGRIVDHFYPLAYRLSRVWLRCAPCCRVRTRSSISGRKKRRHHRGYWNGRGQNHVPYGKPSTARAEESGEKLKRCKTSDKNVEQNRIDPFSLREARDRGRSRGRVTITSARSGVATLIACPPSAYAPVLSTVFYRRPGLLLQREPNSSAQTRRRALGETKGEDGFVAVQPNSSAQTHSVEQRVKACSTCTRHRREPQEADGSDNSWRLTTTGRECQPLVMQAGIVQLRVRYVRERTSIAAQHRLDPSQCPGTQKDVRALPRAQLLACPEQSSRRCTQLLRLSHQFQMTRETKPAWKPVLHTLPAVAASGTADGHA